MKSRNSAKLNRLTDTEVRNFVKAGPAKGEKAHWHNDGGGLYLKVTGGERFLENGKKEPGTASWVFRYTKDGKPHYPGLGAQASVSLKEARDKAHELRKQLNSGIDPLEHRESTRRKVEFDKAKEVTFGYCAKIWLDGKRKICTEKYVKALEWRLRKYAYPLIEHLPIRGIDKTIVLQVLEPIWDVFPVTADSVRSALEEIFDLARARDFRNHDSQNPAQWKGHLKHSGLAPLSKIHTVQHYRDLPYTELPEFITVLQNWDKQLATRRDGTIARCLHFMTLTTTRPGEAAGARWPEIDYEKRLWNIPAERMKGRRPHSVPLSDQAMDIIEEQRERAITSPRLFTPVGRRVRAAIEAHPDFGSVRIAKLAGCSAHHAGHIMRDLKAPPAPLREYIFDRLPQFKKSSHVWRGNLKDALGPMGYGHVDAHGLRGSFSTWCNEERMTVYPRELREFQLAHQVDDAVAGAYQHGTGLALRRRMLQDYADYCHGIVTSRVVPLRRGR
jgi:integrase